MLLKDLLGCDGCSREGICNKCYSGLLCTGTETATRLNAEAQTLRFGHQVFKTS